MINVLLVDDHELVRAGIRRILEDIKGIKVAGEACCGEDAVKWCRANSADVVLMDMNMPGIGGLEATRKIARSVAGTKVIMLTVHTENPLPAKVMQAGAAGYLSKGAAPQEVVNAIRCVASGQRYIASDIAQQMALSQIEPEKTESPFASLSERELQILLDFSLGDKTLLAESLSELAGRRINVQTKPRGDRARYLKLARTNAATALTTKLAQQSTIHQRLQALATVLELPAVKRMECFDISHTMGEQTVASCVVFDSNGPLRAEYRRYNITGITPGDDYAAMNQVLRRRYGKAIDENKIPDVILIDGGKGQLAQAKAVFAELDVPWDKHHPLLLGVAKGSDRKAGLETLFFEPEGEGFSLPPDSPALHVIQHIRDESHDHAISGHRKKRAKVKSTSSLETIEGVGPKRRQMLLKYMGGLQGLQQASVEEIAKVPGISHGLAEKIFYSLKH